MTEDRLYFQKGDQQYYMLNDDLNSLLIEWFRRQGFLSKKVSQQTIVKTHIRKAQKKKILVHTHLRTTKRPKTQLKNASDYARKLNISGLTHIEKTQLIRYVMQRGIEPDLLDFESILDSKLTYYENLEIVKKYTQTQQNDPKMWSTRKLEDEIRGYDEKMMDYLQGLKNRAEDGDQTAAVMLQDMVMEA